MQGIKYRNNKSFFLFLLLSALATGLTSCKKMVTVGTPENKLISDVVFTDDKSALSATAGLYSRMMQTNTIFASSAMTLYPAMSADEIFNTIAGTNDEFSKNSLNISNSTIQNNIWGFGYNYIYQANAIIEGLEKTGNISAEIKNRLLGEAKFIRAFCYFYLVNLFGDIPLVVTTSYEQNAVLPRHSSASIFEQVISDLKEAQTHLASTGLTTDHTRPDKWAVTALLARVYLYRRDWANAELNATTLINAGLYNLETSLAKVFLPASKEIIWQMVPVQPNYNTWEGNLFIPATGIVPSYSLTSFLKNAFEINDQRKSVWTQNITVNGSVYTYPYKYKIRTGATITEYYVVLRLAEQYLIRAEARVQQDKINEALSDINLIRNRAGLTNVITTNKPTILSVIEHERQIELFAEWGHRWFDLKRTGRIDAVLGIVKPSDWASTDALYPIPATEILRNPFLTQNPGY